MNSFLRFFSVVIFVGGFLSFRIGKGNSIDRKDGIFDFCYKDDASECFRMFSDNISHFISQNAYYDVPETKKELIDAAIMRFKEELKKIPFEYRVGEKYKSTKILSLRVGGKTVGFVKLACYGYLESIFCESGEIEILVISKEFRKKGYGKRLLCKAMKYLQEKNAKKIVLAVESKNYGARALYEGAGFKIDTSLVRDVGSSGKSNDVFYYFSSK